MTLGNLSMCSDVVPRPADPFAAINDEAVGNLLPLGICVIDEQYMVHGWNRQLEFWSGFTTEEACGQSLSTLFSSFQGQCFQRRIHDVLEHGVPAVLSTAFHRCFLPMPSAAYPSEPWMWQETRLVRLSVNPPRVVVAIADTTASVCQRKLLQQERAELMRTQAALEAANASLQQSLDQADATNASLHAENAERKKAEDVLRRQTNELIASKAREANHRQHLESLVRDLTTARQQAELAARAKSEFLANMSHEIRTPMTAILGYVDMISDRSLPEDQWAEATSAIHRNGDHLMDIINDILDISKIDAGKLMIDETPLSLRELVTGVASMMQIRARERNLSLDVKFHAPLPEWIRGDATRLRQILVNLIGNALKFTKVGGVLITAEWQNPNSAHGKLLLSVADTGIGIAAETIPTLFQAFVQADGRMTRQYGGTGLGLALSQRLARMLHGDIRVVSQQGVGSTFILELACTAESASPFSEPAGSNTETAPPFSSPHLCALPRSASLAPLIQEQKSPTSSLSLPLAGMNLLVVDDAADNRKLLSYHLAKAGATIELAENGQEALDRISSASPRFDLILMDMQMPVLDGYQAITQLRQRGDRTPVIAITAHAMAGDRDKCLNAGCNDYLTKPIQRDKLISQSVALIQQSLALMSQ